MGLFSCVGTLFRTNKSKNNIATTQAFEAKTFREVALNAFIEHFNTIFKPSFSDDINLDITERIKKFTAYLDEKSTEYDKKNNPYFALDKFSPEKLKVLQKLLPFDENSSKKIHDAKKDSYKNLLFSWKEIKQLRQFIKEKYKDHTKQYQSSAESSLTTLQKYIMSQSDYPFNEISPDEFNTIQKNLESFAKNKHFNTNSIFLETKNKILYPPKDIKIPDNQPKALSIFNYFFPSQNKPETTIKPGYTTIAFTDDEKEFWSTINITNKHSDLAISKELSIFHSLLLVTHSNYSNRMLNTMRITDYTIQILNAIVTLKEEDTKTYKAITESLLSGYGYSSIYDISFATLLKQLSLQFVTHPDYIKNNDNIDIKVDSHEPLWEIFPTESIKDSSVTRDFMEHPKDYAAKVAQENHGKKEAIENKKLLSQKLYERAQNEEKIQKNSEKHSFIKLFLDIRTKMTEQFAQYFSKFKRFDISKNDMTNPYLLIEKLNDYCVKNEDQKNSSPNNKDEYRLKTAQHALLVLESLQSLISSNNQDKQDYLNNIINYTKEGHTMAQNYLGPLSRYRKGESGFASILSSINQMFNDSHAIQEENTNHPKSLELKSYQPLNSQINKPTLTLERTFSKNGG